MLGISTLYGSNKVTDSLLATPVPDSTRRALTTSAVDRGEPDVVDRSSPSSMSKALGSVSGLPSRLARLGRAGQHWHHVSPLPPGGLLRGGPADAFVARGFF